MSFLRPLGQSAGNGLMEEEVGSHDGRYSPQVHPVPLLPGNHLTEELKEGLKDTRMETHIQMREIKRIQTVLESIFYQIGFNMEAELSSFYRALSLWAAQCVTVERPLTLKQKME